MQDYEYPPAPGDIDHPDSFGYEVLATAHCHPQTGLTVMHLKHKHLVQDLPF